MGDFFYIVTSSIYFLFNVYYFIPYWLFKETNFTEKNNIENPRIVKKATVNNASHKLNSWASLNNWFIKYNDKDQGFIKSNISYKSNVFLPIISGDVVGS